MKILDALNEYGYKDKVVALCKKCNLDVYTVLHAIKDYRGIPLELGRVDADYALLIFRIIQSFIAGYVWASHQNTCRKYSDSVENTDIDYDICDRD